MGGNDIHKLYTTDDLKADFQQILIQVNRVISTADIAVTAPLYTALGDICIRTEVLFILKQTLWTIDANL